MADHFPRPSAPASLRARRLIAGGFVRRTVANERLAELHRQCRDDYDSNAARRAQDHRDDAFFVACDTEAKTGERQ